NTDANPQVGLSRCRKCCNSCSNVLNIRAGQKPDTPSQTLVKDATTVGRKIHWNRLFIYITMPQEEAFVETITLHHQPADDTILQTCDKWFGIPAQQSQSFADTYMDHINVGSSGASYIGLETLLPGQHTV